MLQRVTHAVATTGIAGIRGRRDNALMIARAMIELYSIDSTIGDASLVRLKRMTATAGSARGEQLVGKLEETSPAGAA